jgi:Carbohydrate-binding family 9
MAAVPRLIVPRVDTDWHQHKDLAAWDWTDAVTLPSFTLADGGGPALQQTVARVCYNAWGIFTRFDCADRDIWGNGTQRDDPIYDEEVVEIFIGPGEATPVDYYEFEVSPNGVLLDLTVHNPDSSRATIRFDMAWNCPGMQWAAGRNDAQQHWWAVMAIPWAAIGAPAALPKLWRANFYRIERPRDAEAEYSCWSPTMTEPADYHKPGYFGVLELT